MADGPNIERIRWVDATDVLPHEALDFTPWLAGNFDTPSGTRTTQPSWLTFASGWPQSDEHRGKTVTSDREGQG